MQQRFPRPEWRIEKHGPPRPYGACTAAGLRCRHTLFSGFIEGAFTKEAITRLQQRSADFPAPPVPSNVEYSSARQRLWRSFGLLPGAGANKDMRCASTAKRPKPTPRITRTSINCRRKHWLRTRREGFSVAIAPSRSCCCRKLLCWRDGRRLGRFINRTRLPPPPPRRSLLCRESKTASTVCGKSSYLE